MLNNYIQLTQNLIADLKQQMTNPAFLIRYINTARGQIAGEAECIRAIGTVSTVIGQRAYNFSAINLGSLFTTGIQGPIHVRRIQYSVASGQKWIKGKSWEWFDFQKFNNPVPPSGPPTEWAQFGQGSAGTGTGSGSSGSFYLDPLPDMAYTLNCDCVCYPIALTELGTTDTAVEAIPYLWTDAVPYFAAYQAYLSAQNKDKAQLMLGFYEQFMQRARNAANPSLNRYAYPQSGDPFVTGRLGVSTRGNGAGNAA